MLVAALLDDLTILEDHHARGLTDGAEAMGDN
jgi:hypothetical protein